MIGKIKATAAGATTVQEAATTPTTPATTTTNQIGPIRQGQPTRMFHGKIAAQPQVTTRTTTSSRTCSQTPAATPQQALMLQLWAHQARAGANLCKGHPYGNLHPGMVTTAHGMT